MLPPPLNNSFLSPIFLYRDQSKEKAIAGFTWNDSYSVRMQQCDAQHKKLFEMINQLGDAMRVGKGHEAISHIVSQLITYTRTHFLQEEALMERAQYPGLPAHRQLHHKLVEDVEKFQRDLNSGLRPNTVAFSTS